MKAIKIHKMNGQKCESIESKKLWSINNMVTACNTVELPGSCSRLIPVIAANLPEFNEPLFSELEQGIHYKNVLSKYCLDTLLGIDLI